MGIEHTRSEIEHMRVQLGRQRREILQLQRAGIPTASAELLLLRMLAKIEGLCDERDRLKVGPQSDGRIVVPTNQIPHEEIDPDVFGEELDTAAYSCVDRIAAVVLTARKPGVPAC